MSSLAATSSPITVGYWGIRGLGAPLRMMVMYAEAPLQAELYFVKENAEGTGFDRSAWFDKKPALKATNPLMNLPYLFDGDMVITQSNACFTYLGRKFSMLGDGEKGLVDCEQLLCECMDLRKSVVEYGYANPEKIAPPNQFFAMRFTNSNSALEKLELWLDRKADSGGSCTFFVGESATAPDFHIWEMVDQIATMAHYFNLENPFITKYPLLGQFHGEFAGLPKNAKYFSSKLAKLPCNNLSAEGFGATPSGDRYVFGSGGTKAWSEGAAGLYA